MQKGTFHFVWFHNFIFFSPLPVISVPSIVCQSSNLFIYFHLWLSSFPLLYIRYCHSSENKAAAIWGKKSFLPWKETDTGPINLWVCTPLRLLPLPSPTLHPFLNSSDRHFFFWDKSRHYFPSETQVSLKSFLLLLSDNLHSLDIMIDYQYAL